MLLCLKESHAAMKMRHNSKERASCHRLAVCVKFVCYGVMQSFLVCANSHDTIVTDTLEVLAIPTYRLLVKLDAVHRYFLSLVFVKELAQLVPHTFHNTYSHISLLFR